MTRRRRRHPWPLPATERFAGLAHERLVQWSRYAGIDREVVSADAAVFAKNDADSGSWGHMLVVVMRGLRICAIGPF